MRKGSLEAVDDRLVSNFILFFKGTKCLTTLSEVGRTVKLQLYAEGILTNDCSIVVE